MYALTPKKNTPSKSLRLDFYENPDSSHKIINTLLQEEDKVTATYIKSFLSVEIPSFNTLKSLKNGEDKRAKRKILIYWAILNKAGFSADLEKLKTLIFLNPEFSKELREEIYKEKGETPPEYINSLEELTHELELFAEKNREKELMSTSGKGKKLFDPDDVALLGFLAPTSKVSAGPKVIQSLRKYHDHHAGDFVKEILGNIALGKTIILDLGNAAPEVMNYFSEYLSRAIFYRQVDLFSKDELGNHYVQLYFEEAHNLFPASESDSSDIYSRIAKEGAKYHIGMVYSTQSPSTISKDLLAQTENFFILHMSSRDEVKTLSKLNVAYEDIQEDILQTKTPGYMRMLTRSHRFVVPVQARKFSSDINPTEE